MSHSSKIFDSQPIRVQNVNGFDLSHLNCGTAIVGKLTPVLNRLLMQDTVFNLGCAVNVELPPLATNFYGRIDANIEVFFTPCSILYGGWKQFISNQAANMFPQSQGDVVSAGGFALPKFDIYSEYNTISGYNSTNRGLSDYLGLYLGDRPAASGAYINLLPFLAYHRIWDVYYRNAQVTKTIFAVNPQPVSGGSVATLNARNVSLIWHSFYTEQNVVSAGGAIEASSSLFAGSDLNFPDGVSIFTMRQRNYPRDYFTAGSVSPQQGNPSALSMSLNFNYDSSDPSASTVDGAEFSISALRAANSLQKFLEAANYDPTYEGIMRAHFGRRPMDADADEPIYIGRCSFPVYQKSVYMSNDASNTGGSSGNPFTREGLLAAKGASGQFSGEGKICEKFRAGCFGYLTALFTLVPHAMYSQGIDKQLTMLEIGDYPFPELQSVGMDSIKLREVWTGYNYSGPDSYSWDDDFCYIPRYSFMKYIDDSVHGELRPGKSLQSFVLQRFFGSSSLPQFSSAFLQIPESALDDVFASTSSVSNFSCWYEIYWVFKATMPLAEFCMPTLGELQDTHTIKVSQGGSRL